MATKKELEARIAALEAQVALLKAQKPFQPGIRYPYWPYGTWPYTITWGSGSISSGQSGPGQITMNAVN